MTETKAASLIEVPRESLGTLAPFLPDTPWTTTTLHVLHQHEGHAFVDSPESPRNVVVVATPIEGHGWSGEPARNLKVEDRRYSLERRGQSSAYGLGVHGRPNQSRVATYLYRSLDGQVLWLERWGQEIVAATGHEVPAHGVRILQGS